MIANSMPKRSFETTGTAMDALLAQSFRTIPPATSAILPRERLFEALDHARSRPVLWISGPPGSGKTALVASYLAARNRQSHWYHLRESDLDTSALRQTLDHASPGAGPTSDDAAPVPMRAPGDRLIRSVDNGLACRQRSPILVLDDYHQISAGTSLHDLLGAAISEAHSGETAIIVISRSEPPAALARHIANQRIAALTWRDLRFTHAELAAIVDFHCVRPLPPHLRQLFFDRIDGWVAGLQMILARADHKELPIEALGNRLPDAFAAYFTEELLKPARPDVRRFIFATAFLPTISAPMARALTDNPDAVRILDHLVNNNIALHQSDNHSVCAYHPLFREFLITRAPEELGPDEVNHLALTSAQLLQQAGRIAEAVELRTRIGDWTGCAAAIEAHAPILAAQGRLQELEQWTAKLPGHVLEEYPWLLYWRALGLRNLDSLQSHSCLDRALDAFRARGERTGSLMAWYEIGVELQVHPGTTPGLLERWIAGAESLLKTRPEARRDDAEARAHVALLFARCSGRLPRHVPPASGDLRRHTPLAGAAENDCGAEMRACLSLRHLLTGGPEATRASLVGMSAISPVDQFPPDAAIVKLLADSLFYWRRGMVETALQTSRDGLTLAQSRNVHQWDFLLLAQALSCTLSGGDLSSARALRDVMAAELDKQHLLFQSNYRYLAAWDAFVRGDYEMSTTHAAQALHAARVASCPVFEGLAHVALAQIYVAQKARSDAARHIESARRTLARARSPLLMLMHHFVLAQFALDAQDPVTAADALTTAFALAREKHYVNFPWWVPEIMACLCSKALAWNIEVPYVEMLIRRHRLIPSPPLDRFEHWPWPIKIFTLGQFEVVVDGRQLRFSRKVQKKPLELLKFLLAQGGQNVGEQNILAALWPEAEGDAAHRAFAIALHRLRRLLGTEDAIVLAEGQVSLDSRYCWADCLSFQARGGITSAGPSAAGPMPALNGSKLDPVLALYQGPFLPGDDASPWTAAMRERLRMRFVRLVREECERLEGNGALRQAITLYQKGLEADNLAEDFYRGIMRCHLRLAQYAEALANYQRCKLLLSVVLGTKPSDETESLHQACHHR